MSRSKKIITRSMRLNFLSGGNAAVNHQLSTTSRVVDGWKIEVQQKKCYPIAFAVNERGGTQRVSVLINFIKIPLNIKNVGIQFHSTADIYPSLPATFWLYNSMASTHK